MLRFEKKLGKTLGHAILTATFQINLVNRMVLNCHYLALILLVHDRPLTQGCISYQTQRVVLLLKMADLLTKSKTVSWAKLDQLLYI